MAPSPVQRIVTTWYGAFVVAPDGTVARAYPFPSDVRADRRRLRRLGRLAPEEERLLEDRVGGPSESHDARLHAHDVGSAAWELPAAISGVEDPGASALRSALLEEGAEALRASWDPSIY